MSGEPGNLAGYRRAWPQETREGSPGPTWVQIASGKHNLDSDLLKPCHYLPVYLYARNDLIHYGEGSHCRQHYFAKFGVVRDDDALTPPLGNHFTIFQWFVVHNTNYMWFPKQHLLLSVVRDEAQHTLPCIGGGLGIFGGPSIKKAVRCPRINSY